MDSRLLLMVAVCIAVPAVLIGYIVLTEVFLRLVPGPAEAAASGRGCGWRRP